MDERRQGLGEDLLLLCEHEEVVTLGRGAQRAGREAGELAGVRQAGIPVLEIERGGAATYHGPGQLVGYPIVRLGAQERDLHAFLRKLEEALIRTLGRLTPLSVGRQPGLTGVWTEGSPGLPPQKLASIGIACRGWVTYHGFALNLSTELARLSLFRPCDLGAERYTSLAALGQTPPRAQLAACVHAELASLLGRECPSPSG